MISPETTTLKLVMLCCQQERLTRYNQIFPKSKNFAQKSFIVLVSESDHLLETDLEILITFWRKGKKIFSNLFCNISSDRFVVVPGIGKKQRKSYEILIKQRKNEKRKLLSFL